MILLLQCLYEVLLWKETSEVFNFLIPFFRQMILRYDIFCRKITSRYFLPEGKRVNGNNFYCYKNLTHQKFSVTTTYTYSSRNKKGETAGYGVTFILL